MNMQPNQWYGEGYDTTGSKRLFPEGKSQDGVLMASHSVKKIIHEEKRSSAESKVDAMTDKEPDEILAYRLNRNSEMLIMRLL